MKSIEEQLWDYIDGNCTPDDQQAISVLIETDKTYSDKYKELLQLNNEFAHMELDEPPMAFTYNVMETIRAEQAQKPFKAAINPYIIKGIAAFFIVVIAGLLIAMLANTNFANNAPTINKIAVPNIASLLNGRVISIFLFLDTVLGLFFLDTYLRKRRFLKHQ